MYLGEMGLQNGNQTCLTGDDVDERLQARLIDRRVHRKDEFLDHLLNNQIFKEEPQVQICLSPVVRKHLVGHALLIFEVSRSHSDTLHSVGLVQTIDQSVAQTLPDNTHHSQEPDIHAPARIRTRSPSKRKAADPGLRPRGHRDRLTIELAYYV